MNKSWLATTWLALLCQHTVISHKGGKTNGIGAGIHEQAWSSWSSPIIAATALLPLGRFFPWIISHKQVLIRVNPAFLQGVMEEKGQ